ncbi:hypothetical protein [uncultured Duncaniella sp.]|uniref:hypothetical protein n=1 Tax=uncultured Duncaniella sp. TaxID=2768039 RepID=UPI002674631D|nr:hypothetical protein [uncultured Duncaniella sp.]
MRSLLLTTIILLLTGCNNTPVAERIESAEIAYASEDVASARKICDEITGEHSEDGEITSIELGRLSILYMQLYDRTDDDDALELAERCYREAFVANADSARYFYSHLPVDQDKYAMSLATLVHSIDNPGDISDEHAEVDSMMNDCSQDF